MKLIERETMMRRLNITSRNDLTGKIIGLFVFLLGTTVLIFVACLAYSFFTSSSTGLFIVKSSSKSTEPATAKLGESAMILFFKMGLLIIMTVAGSLLAGAGIHFYHGACGETTDQIVNNTEI